MYGDLNYNHLGTRAPGIGNNYERNWYEDEGCRQMYMEYEVWRMEYDERQRIEYEERGRMEYDAGYREYERDFNGNSGCELSVHDRDQFQNWNPFVYPHNEQPASSFTGSPVFRRPSYPYPHTKRREVQRPQRRRRSHLDDVYRANHDDADEECDRRQKECHPSRRNPVLKPIKSIKSENKLNDSLILPPNANKENGCQNNPNEHKVDSNSSSNDKTQELKNRVCKTSDNFTENSKSGKLDVSQNIFKKNETNVNFAMQIDSDAPSLGKEANICSPSIGIESVSETEKPPSVLPSVELHTQIVSQNSPNPIEKEKRDNCHSPANISSPNNLLEKNSTEAFSKTMDLESTTVAFHNKPDHEINCNIAQQKNTDLVKLINDKKGDFSQSTENENKSNKGDVEKKESDPVIAGSNQDITLKDVKNRPAEDAVLLHENGIAELSNTPPVSPQKLKVKLNMLPVPFPVIENAPFGPEPHISNVEKISDTSSARNVPVSRVFPPLPPPLPKTLPPLPESTSNLPLDVDKMDNMQHKMDSDEEAFIKNLDTRKSYLPCDLLDDLSVIDMEIGTPNSASLNYTPPKKKQKVDGLLINTEPILTDIEQFIKETSSEKNISATQTLNAKVESNRLKDKPKKAVKVKNNCTKIPPIKAAHNSKSKSYDAQSCDIKKNENVQKQTKVSKLHLLCELNKKELEVTSKLNNRHEPIKTDNLGRKHKIQKERKKSGNTSDVKKDDKSSLTNGFCVDNKKSLNNDVLPSYSNLSTFKIPKKNSSRKPTFSAVNDDYIKELDPKSFHSQRMLDLFGDEPDDFFHFGSDKMEENRNPEKAINKVSNLVASHSTGVYRSEIAKRRYSTDLNLDDRSSDGLILQKNKLQKRRFSVDISSKESKHSHNSKKIHCNINSQKSEVGLGWSTDLSKNGNKSNNLEKKCNTDVLKTASDANRKLKISDMSKKETDSGSEKPKGSSTIKNHCPTEIKNNSCKKVSVKRLQRHKRKRTSNNKIVEVKKDEMSDKTVLSKCDKGCKNKGKQKRENKKRNAKIAEQILTGIQHCFSFVSEKYSLLSFCHTDLCRAYSTIVFDDCCDEAVILESADIRDFVEIKLMLSKDSSDDIIEVKEDVPFIDLTEQMGLEQEKADVIPIKQTFDKTMKEDSEAQKEILELLESAPQGPIKIFRSEETVDNSRDVQAISASINTCSKDHIDVKKENVLESSENRKDLSETTDSLPLKGNILTINNEQDTQNCSLNDEQTSHNFAQAKVASTSVLTTEQSSPLTENSSASPLLEQVPSNESVANSVATSSIDKATEVVENARLANTSTLQNSRRINRTAQKSCTVQLINNISNLVRMSSSNSAEPSHLRDSSRVATNVYSSNGISVAQQTQQRVTDQLQGFPRIEPIPPYSFNTPQHVENQFHCIWRAFVLFTCFNCALKKAQYDFTENLKRVHQIIPHLARPEIEVSNKLQDLRQKVISHKLVLYLKNYLNFPSNGHDLKLFFNSLYLTINKSMPNITRSFVMRTLNALMMSEKEFYLADPFFKTIFQHVSEVCELLYQRQENLPQRNSSTGQPQSVLNQHRNEYIETINSQVPTYERLSNSQIPTYQPQSNSHVPTYQPPSTSQVSTYQPLSNSQIPTYQPQSNSHVPTYQPPSTSQVSTYQPPSNLSSHQLQMTTEKVNSQVPTLEENRTITGNIYKIRLPLNVPHNENNSPTIRLNHIDNLPSMINTRQNINHMPCNEPPDPHIPLTLSQNMPSNMGYMSARGNQTSHRLSTAQFENTLPSPALHMNQPEPNGLHDSSSMHNPQYATTREQIGLQNPPFSQLVQKPVAHTNSHVPLPLYNNTDRINQNNTSTTGHYRELNYSQNLPQGSSLYRSQVENTIHNNAIPNTQMNMATYMSPTRLIQNNTTQNTFQNRLVTSIMHSGLQNNLAQSSPQRILAQRNPPNSVQLNQSIQNSEVSNSYITVQNSSGNNTHFSWTLPKYSNSPGYYTSAQVSSAVDQAQVLNRTSVPLGDSVPVANIVRTPSHEVLQTFQDQSIAGRTPSRRDPERTSNSIRLSNKSATLPHEVQQMPVIEKPQKLPQNSVSRASVETRTNFPILLKAVTQRSAPYEPVSTSVPEKVLPITLETMKSSSQNPPVSNISIQNKSTNTDERMAARSVHDQELPSGPETIRPLVSTQNSLAENNMSNIEVCSDLIVTTKLVSSYVHDQKLPPRLETTQTAVYARTQNSVGTNAISPSRSDNIGTTRSVRSPIRDPELLSDVETMKSTESVRLSINVQKLSSGLEPLKTVHTSTQNSSVGNNLIANMPLHSDHAATSVRASSRDQELPSSLDIMKTPLDATTQNSPVDHNPTANTPSSSTRSGRESSFEREMPPILEVVTTPVYAPMIYSPRNYEGFDDSNESPQIVAEDTEPDIIWIEDEDPNQLQKEMAMFVIKDEPDVEVVLNQEQFPEPNFELVQIGRLCICAKPADYVCVCRLVMYCSDACQQKDWKVHKKVCTRAGNGIKV